MTIEEIEKIIENEYIDTDKELELVVEEEYNIEFEIKNIEEKVKEENRKSRRWAGETKKKFMLRDYINVINSAAITPSFKLKVVAFAYRKKKNHFEITIYTADRWQEYFVSGIAKILEEHWITEVGEEVTVQYSHSEIIKQKLFISNYLIPSERIQEGELEFFYNNI